MRTTISISLPEEVRNELDEATRAEGLSRSDLVRRALRDYLFVRKFRRLREQTMAQARAKGIFTDEDVFDRVS
ncbi:MAG: ribbon-helix-helix protein, CopG family [Gemmatimonadetes bacterium]|nr:ribbon-helix-helix protein, CopG family [Gemmatimonadota bacterium]